MPAVGAAKPLFVWNTGVRFYVFQIIRFSSGRIHSVTGEKEAKTEAEAEIEAEAETRDQRERQR
jgi:hypothetical protein